MEHRAWECPKCSTQRFRTGKLGATGGLLSKIFDIQTEKFTTVSCEGCGFTELYRADRNRLEDVFDFLTSG